MGDAGRGEALRVVAVGPDRREVRALASRYMDDANGDPDVALETAVAELMLIAQLVSRRGFVRWGQPDRRARS